MSEKPIATEALYGYVKDPDNKDFGIIAEEAAADKMARVLELDYFVPSGRKEF